jgi:hypothetical protein
MRYARQFVATRPAFLARQYSQGPPRTPLLIGRILTIRPTNKMCASRSGRLEDTADARNGADIIFNQKHAHLTLPQPSVA